MWRVLVCSINFRNETSIFRSILKLLTHIVHSEVMRHVPTRLRCSARFPLMETDIRRFQIGKPLGTYRTFVTGRTTRLHLFHIAERHSVDEPFKSASRSTQICHSARDEQHVPTYSKLPSGTADHCRSA